MKRRELFKLGLMSATTVAVAGCGLPPNHQLVSQLDMPEIRLPGKNRYFATVCQECGGGCGVSMRVVDGRAKKLEGIPEHPVSKGKVCARGMSSVQALYNPDRIYAPMHNNAQVTWDEALKALAQQMDQGSGKTLWITRSLRGSSGSLVLAMAEKVGAKVWVLDLDGTQAERAAMKGLTGKSALPYYDLHNADVVLNFGSDFLNNGANPVHYSWAYGQMRGKDPRGIMVSFGPHMNATVANSDKWIPVTPGGEGWVAQAIADALGTSGKKGGASVSLDEVRKHAGELITADLIKRVVARLQKATHAVAIAGPQLAGYSNGGWQMQAVLGLHRTLTRGKILTWEPDGLVALPGTKASGSAIISTKDAVAGLNGGSYSTVWVLDANPVHTLPGKLSVEEGLRKAANLAVFTPYLNETAAVASSQWVLPLATWMESWGDSRVEGPVGPKDAATTVWSTQQPVVELRQGSMPLTDILLYAAHRSSSAKAFPWGTTEDMVKAHGNADQWSQVLARGGVWEAYPLDWEPYTTQAGPIWPPRTVPTTGKAPAAAGSAFEKLAAPAAKGASPAQFQGSAEDKVLIPFLSSVFGDGHASNRPWLQELPDPMGMVVWTDWIEINTDFARTLEVERGDILRLTSPSGSIEGPCYPTPGIHPDAVAIPLGQGHSNYGRFAGRGMQALSILAPQWQEGTGELAMLTTRVKVEKTGQGVNLISLDRRVGGQPHEIIPRVQLKKEGETTGVIRDAHP